MRTENNHRSKLEAGCAKIPVNFIVIFFVCLFITGCGQAQGFSEDQNTTRQKAVDACITAGGVPIIGYWTGYVKECQFHKVVKE